MNIHAFAKKRVAPTFDPVGNMVAIIFSVKTAQYGDICVEDDFDRSGIELALLRSQV